jgi:response regulator of citrate/malate metabolism
MAIVRLEGLSKLKKKKEKKSMSPGIKPATLQLVAQCLNQLHYSVSHASNIIKLLQTQTEYTIYTETKHRL